ncbi:MAG: PKD domain-containing protein, partial [Gammaproteobacteria bacterium]|nr:PKD domain-containing protein [Gammaproteobacteria bacterium]
MKVIPSLRWLVFAALLPTFAMASSDGNTPPQSEAGYTKTVIQGETITLDGSRSYDNDGDSLTYRWTLTPPPGSNAKLSDPTAIMPTFVTDVAGEY